MQNIQKLYDKLWKSLIQPTRLPYSVEDIRPPTFRTEAGDLFIRFEQHVKTKLGHNLAMSVYLPANFETRRMTRECDVVVYMHTHNGMRLQGAPIVTHILSLGLGLCLFDFHGNGQSDGKYVTFGWTETIDLDAVIRHLTENYMVSSVLLWGRSMGAATSILFMSPDFRAVATKFLKEKRDIPNFKFVDRKLVRGIVLDSPFGDLRRNIINFVQSKASKVPELLIDLALKILDKSISSKTGVKLTDIKPLKYAKHITVPTMIIIGDEDEMIRLKEIEKLYHAMEGTQVKKLRLVKGGHSGDRSDILIRQIAQFCGNVLEFNSLRKDSAKFNKIDWSKSYIKTDDLKSQELQDLEDMNEEAKPNRMNIARSRIGDQLSVSNRNPQNPKNMNLNEILDNQTNFSNLAKTEMQYLNPDNLQEFDEVSIGGLDLEFSKFRMNPNDPENSQKVKRSRSRNATRLTRAAGGVQSRSRSRRGGYKIGKSPKIRSKRNGGELKQLNSLRFQSGRNRQNRAENDLSLSRGRNMTNRWDQKSEDVVRAPPPPQLSQNGPIPPMKLKSTQAAVNRLNLSQRHPSEAVNNNQLSMNFESGFNSQGFYQSANLGQIRRAGYEDFDSGFVSNLDFFSSQNSGLSQQPPKNVSTQLIAGKGFNVPSITPRGTALKGKHQEFAPVRDFGRLRKVKGVEGSPEVVGRRRPKVHERHLRSKKKVKKPKKMLDIDDFDDFDNNDDFDDF